MNNITLIPYLNFNGQTAEAMKFYQSIFGGDLQMQTYKEAQVKTPPEQKDLVMHARLENESVIIMASDARPDDTTLAGNNVHLSLNGVDEERLTQAFNGLAAGGEITDPLSKRFWGDQFGTVTDKFGIHWMVNIGSKK